MTALWAITLLHIAMGSILVVAYLGLFDIGGSYWRVFSILGVGDLGMYQRQCVRALLCYAVAVLVQNAVVCVWLQLKSWNLALKVAAFALLCPVLDSLLWTGPRLLHHLLNPSAAYHFAPFIAHHFGMISSWMQFRGNLQMELLFPFIWFLGFFVLAKTVVTLVIVRSITRKIGDV